MTGIICKQAKECAFYRMIYKANFNNAVINPYGERYTCDVINDFLTKLSKGDARLSKKSLAILKDNVLECIVLEKFNLISSLNKKP